jgi:hypothetical protein
LSVQAELCAPKDVCAGHHDRINVVGVGHSLDNPIPVARIGSAVKAVMEFRCLALLFRQVDLGNASEQDAEDAITIRRSSTRFMPRDLFGSTRLMRFHSKSLMSDRAIFLLPPVVLEAMNHKSF